VTSLDLMPTILKAAGIKAPPRLHGISRIPGIRHGRTGWKGPVFLENINQKDVDGKPAIERAVRTEGWKLILRDHLPSALYDLEADPGESHDLYVTSPRKVLEVTKLLRMWGEAMQDPVAIKLAGRHI
jgi:arylsulfatase A-like enzyme